MKNIFFNRHARKNTLLAVCIQTSLMGGGMYYASDVYAHKPAVEVTTGSLLHYQDEKGYVNGTITASNGETIIGATIQVKGTSVGVITDIEGRFSVKAPGNAILVISCIGYQTQEIRVNNKKNLNIVLQESVQDLEEVTVVAYGTQKKATLTGAISSINTEALLKSPSGSIANTLAGQLTGVSSVQYSGQPGADDAKLFVRGVGSLTEDGATPLILVDGVERDFFQMDANEIESINVLKDASATAVFGVRGANGVILVTTRRGKEGKPVISVSSSVSAQVPTRILKTADSYTTALFINEQSRAKGIPEKEWHFQPDALEHFRLGDEPILYPNVNWYDYMMNDMSIQTQHNLNISGGTKDVRYFVSLGFFYQNGLFKDLGGLDYDNNFNYTRYNYRANLDVNLTPTTLLKFNMGGIVGSKLEPQKNVWQLLSQSFPFTSPGVVDGKKIAASTERFKSYEFSPQVLDNYYGDGNKRTVSNTMNFDLQLTQKLDFLTKGLSAEVKGAYNTDYSYAKETNGHIESYQAFYKSEVDGSGLKEGDPGFDKTVVYRIAGEEQMRTVNAAGTSRGRNWYIEGSLRYNRAFNNHNVSALLLYNQSKKYYPEYYSDVPSAYVGFVGRLTYDYKSKYLAEFNIGHNGSENFAPGKRYGTFPAGSVGYIISEEDFFPKNDILTYLKLRGSVGLVGNDNMQKYRFLYLPDAYSYNDGGSISSWSDPNGYIFGLTNTVFLKAARETRLANQNVTWETSLKQNYGLDAYFFKDRLKLTVDVFNEKRRDILTTRNTLPSLLAIQDIMQVVNLGKVNNHGYEVELKWTDRVRDFSYYVNANVSYSKSKVVFQDEVPQNEPYMGYTGREVGARLGYVSQGFYTKDDFNADGSLKEGLPVPEGGGVKLPGDVKFADLNGDGVIDPDDVTQIGKPKRPRYTFGLNFGAEYKGFFASMNWTGVTGCDLGMSEAFKRPLESGYVLYQFFADGMWTEETAGTARYPRFTQASDDNLKPSRIWLQDGSYLKLKNLTIGYNITNKKILDAIGASKFSVTFRGYNLLTFDKVKIFDPEGELSKAGNTYPITKIFSLGVNLTF